jgi:hypothetical protein
MKTILELKTNIVRLTRAMANLQGAERSLRTQYNFLKTQYDCLLKKKNTCQSVYIATGASDLQYLEQEILNISYLHSNCVHYLQSVKIDLQNTLQSLKGTEIMDMIDVTNIDVVVHTEPVYKENIHIEYLVEGEDDDGFCLEVQVFA